MNLSDQRLKTICSILSRVAIIGNGYLDDEDIKTNSARIARKIFENSEIGYKKQDNRTYEQVFLDVYLGEVGEVSLVDYLRSVGFSTHNSEETTGSYHWDIKFEGLFGEIKHQGDNGLEPRTTFSFNDSKRDENLRLFWRSIDFIIAFYTKTIKVEGEDIFLIVPWLLIDSNVIDPSLKIYLKSKFDDGHFLAMRKPEAKRYFVELNQFPSQFNLDDVSFVIPK